MQRVLVEHLLHFQHACQLPASHGLDLFQMFREAQLNARLAAPLLRFRVEEGLSKHQTRTHTHTTTGTTSKTQ